jgi:hypothetical protein
MQKAPVEMLVLHSQLIPCHIPVGFNYQQCCENLRQHTCIQKLLFLIILTFDARPVKYAVGYTSFNKQSMKPYYITLHLHFIDLVVALCLWV